MRCIVLVGALLCCGSNALATSDSTLVGKKKVHYYIQFTSGALTGCTSCDHNEFSLSMSLLQGVRIANEWRVGAGFGLDSYPFTGLSLWQVEWHVGDLSLPNKWQVCNLLICPPSIPLKTTNGLILSRLLQCSGWMPYRDRFIKTLLLKA